MIVGNRHVQWRLQVDAVPCAGRGRGLLRLQVGVGALLQELRGEAGQPVPTGRVQRGFSLGGSRWATQSDSGQESPSQRANGSLCPETLVPRADTALGPSCHQLTMTRHTLVCPSHPCAITLCFLMSTPVPSRHAPASSAKCPMTFLTPVRSVFMTILLIIETIN